MQDQIDAAYPPHNVAPSNAAVDNATTPAAVPTQATDKSIKHRAADLLQLQAEVRFHMRELLGMDPTSDAPWMDVPSEQETGAFAKTKKGGPSLDNFRPDLAGPISSAWNQRIMEIFADHFVGQSHFSEKSKTVVQKILKVHLRTLKTKYLTALRADSEQPQDRIDAMREEAREQRRRAVRRS
jgi:hypothetical protein